MRLTAVIGFALLISASATRPGPYRGFASSDPRELVFGIELTVEGATCAAYLPSGQIKGLISVKGGQEHSDLMRSWHDISLKAAIQPTTTKEFLIAEFPKASREHVREVENEWQDHFTVTWSEWLYDKLGLSSKTNDDLFALDYYQGDEATAILTTTMSDLRNATWKLLANNTELHLPVRPFAELALPGWFFKRMSHFDEEVLKEEPHLVNDTYIGAWHLRALTERISTAVHHAGFRRSVDDVPGEIMSYHAKGELLLGPLAAPKLAIQQATSVPCPAERFVELEDCMEQRKYPTPLTALIDRTTAAGSDWTSLWIQDERAHMADPGIWQSRTHKIPTASSADETSRIFETMSSDIRSALSDRSSLNASIAVVLTGDSWSPESENSLELSLALHNISYQLVHSQEQPFLAAIGAAEEARYEVDGKYICHLQLPDEAYQHGKNTSSDESREL